MCRPLLPTACPIASKMLSSRTGSSDPPNSRRVVLPYQSIFKLFLLPESIFFSRPEIFFIGVLCQEEFLLGWIIERKLWGYFTNQFRLNFLTHFPIFSMACVRYASLVCISGFPQLRQTPWGWDLGIILHTKFYLRSECKVCSAPYPLLLPLGTCTIDRRGWIQAVASYNVPSIPSPRWKRWLETKLGHKVDEAGSDPLTFGKRINDHTTKVNPHGFPAMAYLNIPAPHFGSWPLTVSWAPPLCELCWPCGSGSPPLPQLSGGGGGWRRLI